MDTTIITAIISVAAALSGMALGWSARAREMAKKEKDDTERDAMLRADMEYIKRGVDDIRVEQRDQGQKVDVLSERVTRVEESAKQAHKRIDRVEAERS